MAKEVTAGLVPAPGSLVTPAGLAMAEGYSAPDVGADAARCRAWFEVPGQAARVARSLIGVGDAPRLAGGWRSFLVGMENEIVTLRGLVLRAAEPSGGQAKDNDDGSE